jgi:hypothetical protein
MSKIKSVKILLWSRVGVAILAVTATTFVVGKVGLGFASIPDSGGVIHGCYEVSATSSAYPLKVIDTATNPSCPVGYTSVNWNQTGPRGPAGTARDVGQVDPFAGGGPAFAGGGLKGWVSVTSPGTGEYCLRPDARSTSSNSALIVSPGAIFGAGTGGLVVWEGACGTSPFEFWVNTYSPSDVLSNSVSFTAIVP